MTENIEDIKLIDPFKITKEDLPLFVFSDDLRGFVAWIIKDHTNGNYNHIMMMIEPNKLATQGTLFSSIPLDKYVKPYVRLKFWQPIVPQEVKDKIIEEVNKELKAPWYTRIYDYVGIGGQGIKIPMINIPWLKYCSERTNKPIEIVFKYFNSTFKNKHMSPKQVNQLFIDNPDKFKVFGRWFAD